MKTNFRSLALSAAILSMFTACQREELEQNQAPETQTHTVTFVAGEPDTKTTATIDGENVIYNWTESDKTRFTVYENGEAAQKTDGTLGADGKMTLIATFEGAAPKSPKYQALYNTQVEASQNITKDDAYAETSDVMVSELLDTPSSEDSEGSNRLDKFVFRFNLHSRQLPNELNINC